MQDAAESTQERGFAESGNALQKNMAAREKADENAVNHLLLADDHFSDFLANLIQSGDGGLDRPIHGHTSIVRQGIADPAPITVMPRPPTARPSDRRSG